MLATSEREHATDLEALMMHPAPADLGPMYEVRLVDNRWTILRPATGEQVYFPPNFLHECGKGRESLEQIVDQLNMGCRYIDVIIAHEVTYNPRNVGEC